MSGFNKKVSLVLVMIAALAAVIPAFAAPPILNGGPGNPGPVVFTFFALPTPVGMQSAVVATSDNGVFQVGYVFNEFRMQPVIWSKCRLQYLPVDFRPEAVNNRGDVVGYMFTTCVPAARIGGSWIVVNVAGFASGNLTSINNAGKAVGYLTHNDAGRVSSVKLFVLPGGVYYWEGNPDAIKNNLLVNDQGALLWSKTDLNYSTSFFVTALFGTTQVPGFFQGTVRPEFLTNDNVVGGTASKNGSMAPFLFHVSTMSQIELRSLGVDPTSWATPRGYKDGWVVGIDDVDPLPGNYRSSAIIWFSSGEKPVSLNKQLVGVNPWISDVVGIVNHNMIVVNSINDQGLKKGGYLIRVYSY